MIVGLRKKGLQLSIIALVAGVFFSQARVSADVDTLSATLYSNGTTANVKEIISNYCAAVLGEASFPQDNQFIYNARYSTFVYLLCNNAASSAGSELTSNYFIRPTFKQLGFQDFSSDENSRDLCSPMTNDCTLAKHIPNLFNSIMTDYVNIKQSNIYGLAGNFTNDATMQDQIKNFSLANFGIDICSKTTSRTYPKTCAIMKGYIKNSKNLLSDVYVLNASGLLDMGVIGCNTRDDNYNILLCGLYGDNTTSFVSFVNLSYNELFYYRLFMGYYLVMLQQNPSTLLKNSQNRSLSTITKKFSTQYTRSKDAMSLTFRMLRDTAMAFPMHIGMEMYKEDLDGFGKLLAKIATPIYTLYDKLRNVQKPE